MVMVERLRGNESGVRDAMGDGSGWKWDCSEERRAAVQHEGGVGNTEVIRARLRRYIDETRNYMPGSGARFMIVDLSSSFYRSSSMSHHPAMTSFV
jgi:hypothetical protein